jgi:hypothetical protein
LLSNGSTCNLYRMEHDPDVVPMKFLFRLLDAPLLRTSVGLYTLESSLTHSLKALGFNP